MYKILDDVGNVEGLMGQIEYVNEDVREEGREGGKRLVIDSLLRLIMQTNFTNKP